MHADFTKFCELLLTLQRKSHLCIPFLGISQPQPQFLHSCVCERFVQSQDRSTYFLQQNRQTDRGNIYITHRRMNVEIGTETPIFLLWEYLFHNFGILPLQCLIIKFFELPCAEPFSSMQDCKMLTTTTRPAITPP